MTTILLVDDEYALVETLTDLLEQEGYVVVSAGNGKDGLARAIERRPDLVVTDFMMAIGDGAELTRAVRSLPGMESLPIVMMSATAKAVATASVAQHISSFVKKPFSWKQLLAVIVSHVGEARPGSSSS